MNALERTQARLRGEPVDQLPAHPLFMIYAADHIGASYAEYVRDSRVLVRAQLALCDAWPLDVVSCCSDAWREAADCGAQLVFEYHAPPHAAGPVLRTAHDLAALRRPDPKGGGRMTDRLRAIESFIGAVKGEMTILGWVEGPIAAAVNLLGMTAFMLATKKQPDFIRALLDWTTEMETQFATAQVEAGADMIGIGDAAASLVSPTFYRAEIAPRERRIVDAIHAAGGTARLHICGDVRGKFADLASTGADLVDIDYPQSLADVRRAVGPDVCLAGNVNPVEVLLRGQPEDVAAAFAACHAAAGERYILAAGCEVPPGTPDENIAEMFDYAADTQ